MHILKHYTLDGLHSKGETESSVDRLKVFTIPQVELSRLPWLALTQYSQDSQRRFRAHDSQIQCKYLAYTKDSYIERSKSGGDTIVERLYGSVDSLNVYIRSAASEIAYVAAMEWPQGWGTSRSLHYA